MIPLLMVLTIDGPLHEIHREMAANAMRQGATRLFVVALGPESPSEVSQWLPPGVTVVSTTPPEAAPYVPTIRERIVSAMLNPERAFVALALGMLLIFAEFCFPGSVLPGALGGVVVMTALYGLSASNLRYSGILLLVGAACLFASSVYFKPHTILVCAAAIAMCVGAMLLVDARPGFRIGPQTAAGITIPFAMITFLLTGTAHRARTNKIPEQNTRVVFTSPNDIFSTISGESGEQSKRATAARRT